MTDLAEAGCIAVLRGPSAAHARLVGELLLEAGFAALEVTFTVPRAPEVIAHLRRRAGDGRLVGAGTITEAQHAHLAVDAGAQFLVSPGFEPELWDTMASTGLPALPGVLTPSEVLRALRAGATAVKLFPASVVGPGYLAALRGPFPGVTFVPTGGLTAASMTAWLEAGALAVGLGGALAPSTPPVASAQVIEEARAALSALHGFRGTA